MIKLTPDMPDPHPELVATLRSLHQRFITADIIEMVRAVLNGLDYELHSPPTLETVLRGMSKDMTHKDIHSLIAVIMTRVDKESKSNG